MFTPKNQVANLQKKSSQILDVFTKTVSDLTKVNAEIQAVSDQKTLEKEQLEKELSELSNQKDSNNKIVDKINKIFE